MVLLDEVDELSGLPCYYEEDELVLDVYEGVHGEHGGG